MNTQDKILEKWQKLIEKEEAEIRLKIDTVAKKYAKKTTNPVTIRKPRARKKVAYKRFKSNAKQSNAKMTVVEINETEFVENKENQVALKIHKKEEYKDIDVVKEDLKLELKNDLVALKINKKEEYKDIDVVKEDLKLELKNELFVKSTENNNCGAVDNDVKESNNNKNGDKNRWSTIINDNIILNDDEEDSIDRILKQTMICKKEKYKYDEDLDRKINTPEKRNVCENGKIGVKNEDDKLELKQNCHYKTVANLDLNQPENQNVNNDEKKELKNYNEDELKVEMELKKVENSSNEEKTNLEEKQTKLKIALLNLKAKNKKLVRSPALKEDPFRNKDLLKTSIRQNLANSGKTMRFNPHFYKPKMHIPVIDSDECSTLEHKIDIPLWVKNPKLLQLFAGQSHTQLEEMFRNDKPINLQAIFPDIKDLSNDSPNKWSSDID